MLHCNHLGNFLGFFFDNCSRQSVVYRVLGWQMALSPQIFCAGHHKELRFMWLCFHLDGQDSSSQFSDVSEPLFILKSSEQNYASRRNKYLKRIQLLHFSEAEQRSLIYWCLYCERSCCINSVLITTSKSVVNVSPAEKLIGAVFLLDTREFSPDIQILQDTSLGY